LWLQHLFLGIIGKVIVAIISCDKKRGGYMTTKRKVKSDGTVSLYSLVTEITGVKQSDIMNHERAVKSVQRINELCMSLAMRANPIQENEADNFVSIYRDIYLDTYKDEATGLKRKITKAKKILDKVNDTVANDVGIVSDELLQVFDFISPLIMEGSIPDKKIDVLKYKRSLHECFDAMLKEANGRPSGLFDGILEEATKQSLNLLKYRKFE